MFPRRFFSSALLPLVGALFAPASLAQQIDIALCGAASTSSTACQWTSVQSVLQATGLFGTVDIINVTTGGTGTPTLPQLQAYDALLCWTNSTPADTNAWGDVLADYVDAGGGVVVAVFANSTTTTNRNIGGRWQAGYEVIMDQSGTTSGAGGALGTVLQPTHPIMSGVTSFTGGTLGSRPTGTVLEVGATLIAQWNDGRVLVAEGANPKRVDLGFYPPQSSCSQSGWATGGDVLMANALLYVAGASSCPVPLNYCTSSTTTNGCNPTMSASGTPTAGASSGFTLTANAVEGQKSGLIFYGTAGTAALPWATGSTSFLCVKTPTQRTAFQSSGGTIAGCDGTLAVDFLAFLAANPGALGAPGSAGQMFHAQCWFRDPPAPKTTNLSDGLEFVLCP